MNYERLETSTDDEAVAVNLSDDASSAYSLGEPPDNTRISPARSRVPVVAAIPETTLESDEDDFRPPTASNVAAMPSLASRAAVRKPAAPVSTARKPAQASLDSDDDDGFFDRKPTLKLPVKATKAPLARTSVPLSASKRSAVISVDSDNSIEGDDDLLQPPPSKRSKHIVSDEDDDDVQVIGVEAQSIDLEITHESGILTPPPIQTRVNPKHYYRAAAAPTAAHDIDSLYDDDVQVIDDDDDIQVESAAASHEMINIQIVPFRNAQNPLSKLPLKKYVISTSDSFSSTFSQFITINKLDNRQVVFCLNGTTLLKYATPQSLKLKASATINVCTAEFYESMNKSLQQKLDNITSRAMAAEDAIELDQEPSNNATPMIYIKLNARGKVDRLQFAMTATVAEIVTAYKERTDIAAAVTVRLKFDGEFMDAQETLADVEASQDDQFDIVISA